jgi:hypothetical protein
MALPGDIRLSQQNSPVTNTLAYFAFKKKKWVSSLPPMDNVKNIFLCKLQMGKISYIVCSWQAIQA